MENKKDVSKNKEKRNDILFWVITGLVVASIIITLLVFNSNPSPTLPENNVDYNQVVVKNYGCENNYLGICYDEDSSYYGCNLIDEVCDQSDFELVSKIKILEDNNITIYGATSCSWCQKEYSEFGKYGQSVLDRGIFTFCDTNWTEGCEGVESIPAWKKNGIIVDIGYMSLEDLR